MTSGEKTKMRRRLIIKKSGNRAGLSMRRVVGSTEINGRHEGQFFGVKIILQPKIIYLLGTKHIVIESS